MCDLQKQTYWKKTEYGERDSQWQQWTVEAKLTGTGDNGNIAQQAEDLRAEEGAVPNTEEFVKESLWTGKRFLVEKCGKI